MNKFIGSLIILGLMIIFAAIIFSMVSITGKDISVSNTFDDRRAIRENIQCINGMQFISRDGEVQQIVDEYGRGRRCYP